MTASPMFPLGTVLFPGQVLPLHVFEPRYRAMVRVCLDGDRTFGVVLIERGSEVGGEDVRSDLGTLARIVEAEELPDGRWVLAAVGTGKLQVDRWLPDDPYPQAHVTPIEDGPATDATGAAYEAAVVLLRRALALRTELGEPTAPSTVELTDDPAVGSFHAAALSPVGPLDRQRLLGAPDPDGRLALLTELLADEVEVLTQRLEMG